MIEQLVVEKFIFDTLSSQNYNNLLAQGSGNYGKAIFTDVIPQNEKLPAIVFQMQTGSDIVTQEKARGMTTFRYLIKTCHQAAGKTVGAQIAEIVDDALDNKFFLYDDSNKKFEINSRRMNPFSLPVIEEGGKRYIQIGGIYEFIIRPKEQEN